MERGARVLQTSKDVDKYVLIVEVSYNNSKNDCMKLLELFCGTGGVGKSECDFGKVGV